MTDDETLTRRLASTLAEAGAALPAADAGSVGGIRTRLARRRRRARLTSAVAATTVALATVATLAGPYLGLPRLDRPPAATTGGTLRTWGITGVENNPGLRTCIEDFNEGPGPDVELVTHANDMYADMLSWVTPEDAPEIYETWGGAELADSARAGDVVDLTDALADRPEVPGTLLDSVLAGGRVDGRQYGVPMSGVQPVVLFYNKRVLAEAGLQPPRTYADLLTAVDTLRAREVVPIAVAGAEYWSVLLYLSYFTDRLAGPGVFADIRAGRPGAWEHPAVREAAAMIQEMVRRGAFGDNVDALSKDTDATSRMLAGGGAAMQVMGSWEYSDQLALDPGFATGDLGWVPFPAVADGTGDPADLVGVPANYFAVDARDPRREEAVDFVLRTVASPDFLDGLIQTGAAPAVKDLDALLGDREHTDFIRFAHRLATEAPAFTLVWDQALPKSTADAVKSGVRQLFLLITTPDQFVAAMAGTG